jgi:hypothetical protein
MVWERPPPAVKTPLMECPPSLPNPALPFLKSRMEDPYLGRCTLSPLTVLGTSSFLLSWSVPSLEENRINTSQPIHGSHRLDRNWCFLPRYRSDCHYPSARKQRKHRSDEGELHSSHAHQGGAHEACSKREQRLSLRCYDPSGYHVLGDRSGSVQCLPDENREPIWKRTFWWRHRHADRWNSSCCI